MLHEHHGVRLLQQSQINVPPFGVARTAEEALEQAKKIGLNLKLNKIFKNNLLRRKGLCCKSTSFGWWSRQRVSLRRFKTIMHLFV